MHVIHLGPRSNIYICLHTNFFPTSSHTYLQPRIEMNGDLSVLDRAKCSISWHMFHWGNYKGQLSFYPAHGFVMIMLGGYLINLCWSLLPLWTYRQICTHFVLSMYNNWFIILMMWWRRRSCATASGDVQFD